MNTEYKLFLAIILSTVMGTLLIAKHYNNQYFLPYASLSGLILFLFWKIASDKIQKRLAGVPFVIFLLLLIIFPSRNIFANLSRGVRGTQEMLYDAKLIQSKIDKNDFLFIEPTWMSGPFIENGLIFGNAFVSHNHLYYNNYERFYPNLLSYYGPDSPIRFAQMIEADNEAILKSGKNICVLSTPGRNAGLLGQYLINYAQKYGITLQQDTCYRNGIRSEYLIKFRNINNWRIKASGRCGFEKYQDNKLLTDDGNIQLEGNYNAPVHEKKCNGLYSLRLDSTLRRSPAFIIKNISKGDYLIFTIKCTSHPDSDKKQAKLCVLAPGENIDSIATTKTYTSPNISEGWYLTRLSVEVKTPVADKAISCYVEYTGVKATYIDDFSFEHYSNR